VAHGLQQRTEDARLGKFEVPPDFFLPTSSQFADGQPQKNHTVAQIPQGDDVLNASEIYVLFVPVY
jgi:hypothetical protein